MKKSVSFLTLCIIIAVSVLFAACRKQVSVSTRPTVMLLTEGGGIYDRSFNASAWRGILEFYGDTWRNQDSRGVYYQFTASNNMSMHVPDLRQATDENYDLIVTTGFIWAGSVMEVAAQNPSQKYMVVDVAGLNLPNVMEATFAEHEASFLVGAAAALKAQADGITNPSFGFIGGVAGALITKFHVGFVQGVLAVLPNARFVDYYADNWSRPDLAREQAMNWYDNGVYAIFSAAGGTGNGTITQARILRSVGRNVWAIGVDSDQHEAGLYNNTDSAVLTSMLKRVENCLLYALRAVENNNFQGGHITFGLADDGVGFSTTNPAMTQDIVNRVNQFKQQIISGQISVAHTYAEARGFPGFPQNLQAID